MSTYAQRLANKRSSTRRLTLHVFLFTLVAILLLGFSIYGQVTLFTQEGVTYQEALKTAQTQTLARNLKQLDTWGKIHYNAQANSVLLFIFGAICAAAAAFLWRVSLKKDNGSEKYKVSGTLEAFDFIFPFLVGLAVFTIYPIINVVLMSFQEKYNATFQTFSGWGLLNYERVLADKKFTSGLINTGIYVVFVVPISTCIAILIANLLNRKVRCSALFQTAYFLPMVTAAMATGLAWKFMFNERGLINYILSWFGVDPIGWLIKSQYNIWALIIYGVWNILPFTIILMLSGLQNIDETYYTAARVDGAKSTRIFFRITVPLLAPTISLVLIINSISSAKVFSDLFPLFNGGPGVFENLYTVVYYIYFNAFLGGSRGMGGAAAASIVLFLILFVLTLAQQYIQRKWKYQ